MIIDAHTHVWRRWPLNTRVPDPESRGTAEQLLFEMDQAGVDQAVVICTEKAENRDNNDYAAECQRRWPDRLITFADVGSAWTDHYHASTSAERLAEAAKKYALRGVTYYPDHVRRDYEWWDTEDGERFFGIAEDQGLIVSLPLYPEGHNALQRLAVRHPGLVFLCHHLAGARDMKNITAPHLVRILSSADTPNIWIKVCGFHYISAKSWEYPFRDLLWMVRVLCDAYGPERLVWGSDFPACTLGISYRQSLELFRTHCDFLPQDRRDMILGGNMKRLLG